MNTLERKIDMNHIDMNVIKEASEILKKGGLVAFPTETVYGLGANALDSNASSKKENSTSCVLSIDSLYTLNLENESINTKIFILTTSPEVKIKSILSFQSSCACLPLSVSYLIGVAFDKLPFFLVLKY